MHERLGGPASQHPLELPAPDEAAGGLAERRLQHTEARRTRREKRIGIVERDMKRPVDLDALTMA